MKHITVILALFALMNPAATQNYIQQIDSLVTLRGNEYELSGNVLVAKKAKIVYQKSTGMANTASKTPITAASAFTLASVSKLFTSVAILQLNEKGKLHLDDPVKKYIPELNNGAITVRHLLTHTSGLADYQILEKPYFQDTSKVFTLTDIPSAINNDTKAFRSAPGEKWSYSNPGYNLLALIVERIAKTTFSDYLSKQIFKPSGMLHTYITTPLIKVNDPERVSGYDYLQFAPWVLQRADSLKHNQIELLHIDGLVGMANVVSTTQDLLNFDQALYTGKILKHATLEKAFTPIKLNNGTLAEMGWKNNISNFGLGWYILKDARLGKVVFHTGGMPGAVTAFIRNITKRQTVIVLNNVTHRSTHGSAMSLMYLMNGGKAQTDKKSVANEFTRILLKGSLNDAWARLNTIKADTANFSLDEQEMNMAGLGMFFNNFKAQAMEVLRLNTVLYPNSPNVYDSLAMVLADTGDKQNAILMYRKALALNPKLNSAITGLKKLNGD
ncbi:serine hydrolase [Pedobacter ginsengisoli]|uniref:serine hydrolase n=1 Tax=Pedobacter ginsengisoli TaxID=363852 RepID=UPI00254E8CDD|nr:serine hydrolase [Pedobacter ginsengisoli]